MKEFCSVVWFKVRISNVRRHCLPGFVVVCMNECTHISFHFIPFVTVVILLSPVILTERKSARWTLER